MRRLFFVLAVLACTAAFVGCGTDQVLAPDVENNAVTTSEAVSQPFVLDTAVVDTLATTETQPPSTDPPPKKKKDPPPEPPKTEDATWGSIKAMYR